MLVAVAAFALAGSGAGRAQSSNEPLSSAAPGSVATVAREPTDGSVVLQLDDGSYEAAFGVGSGNPPVGSQAVFLNRFTPDPSIMPFTVDSVSILFPVHNSVGLTNLAPGQPFDVLVFVDPAGTAVPANATLAARKSFLLAPSDTAFQEIRLDTPVLVRSGDVWAGFTNAVTRTDNAILLPAAFDAVDGYPERSWYFANQRAGDHFDGPLGTAEVMARALGILMIRASGQAGGLTCVRWDAPAASLAGGLAPPADARICVNVPAPRDDSFERPRDALTGYNVYRSSQPGVQPTPENFFTSTPPTVTIANSSVAPGGSFFVVTAVYDTGESGPSNEVAIVPPTVTSLKVTSAKIVAKGTGFTPDLVQVFVDGIPFVNPAVIKGGGAKLVQKGPLVTGQTVGAYLAEHTNRARIDLRNSTGAIRAVAFSR
jgi:hypothetical protein